MSRPLCTHAGPLTGEGRWRECLKPERGGQCRRLEECTSCELWEAKEQTPPPRPKKTRVELDCIHLLGTAPPPDRVPTTKTYVQCDALGVKCRCACNARCPEYEPEQE